MNSSTKEAKRYPFNGKMQTALEISLQVPGLSKAEVAAYMQHGNPLDGRGCGVRYIYPKDGLDYSAQKIAEMEGMNVQSVRSRLIKGLPLDHEFRGAKLKRKGSAPMIVKQEDSPTRLAQWGYA